MWYRRISLLVILASAAAIAAPPAHHPKAAAKPAVAASGNTDPVTVSPNLPPELNPTDGGAPRATQDQAAFFAWQEFIALNWPADRQTGQKGQRDRPNPGVFCGFGSEGCDALVTWETMRSKVETFPGNDQPPPGYTNDASQDYGYDHLPEYNYSQGVNLHPCDPAQANDQVPWVNLDETDQITLNNMYAGVVQTASDGNTQPKLIRFLAKSNRAQYVYVASHQWWNVIPASVTQATRDYLSTVKASPPAGSATMVSQFNGTVEVKAGWRELTPDEVRGKRFHMEMVRFYEKAATNKYQRCWRDGMWGLVSLHIIQKTPTAPYFIYATFEQADNIMTADGQPVEDDEGRMANPPATATTPQVCLNDPQPTKTSDPPTGTSKLGSVVSTNNPATCAAVTPVSYCTNPGKRIYYRNVAGSGTNTEPSGGDICVDKRVNPIPSEIVNANAIAHQVIRTYVNGHGLQDVPWLHYKLVNVQYYPYDKVITTQTPNGSLYDYAGPYNAQHPSPANYYLANIVVETNRSLQQFSGGLSPFVTTEWDDNGGAHKNTAYRGLQYNMGGCMGCHGSQGQDPSTNPTGDFSVILSRGAVITPEPPAEETSAGAAQVERNRSLSK